MKLYLLTTKGLGDFYVASTTATNAERKLISMLDHAEYGFFGDRLVLNIRLLASELGHLGDKPNFSAGDKLILDNPTHP